MRVFTCKTITCFWGENFTRLSRLWLCSSACTSVLAEVCCFKLSWLSLGPLPQGPLSQGSITSKKKIVWNIRTTYVSYAPTDHAYGIRLAYVSLHARMNHTLNVCRMCAYVSYAQRMFHTCSSMAQCQTRAYATRMFRYICVCHTTCVWRYIIVCFVTFAYGLN